LAVQTGAWVLYEIENGKLTVTQKVAQRKPVKEYLAMQKRYRHITDTEMAEIQALIDKKWKELGLN
jgi:pyruvate ferredoxin oxidoreductase beta subunit